MALMLRRQRNGTFRSDWYGEYKDESGKRTIINTGVKWAGSPPCSGSLRDIGDASFERSRERAQAVLDNYRGEARHKGNAAHLVERLIETKTGRAVEHTKIAELANKWVSPARRKSITDQHAKVTEAEFQRFLTFLSKHKSEAVYLYEVTHAEAEAYAKDLFDSLAPRTARGHLALLRNAFEKFMPIGASNPFESIIVPKTAKDATVHRRPFTVAEIQAILEAAADDDMMRDLITAAACSGLRRGDLCTLTWKSVDIPGGMLTVKTSKSGAEVEIPIFAPLQAVLESRKGNGSKYVFPEAAEMMARNPQGLSYRFKQVVARALDTGTDEVVEQVIDAAEIEQECTKAIMDNVPESPRRYRILTAFERYCKGETFREIEKETGIPRGVISADLRHVEGWTGKRFVRSVRGRDIKEQIARVTRTERKHGQKAASLYDWHALRTTFVTLALSAGVPMELVRRVTGHKTVEIVLTNYFRPGRDEFRKAFEHALPEVIAGEKKKPKALPPAEEMSQILEKISSGTATAKDKTRLKKLAAMV